MALKATTDTGPVGNKLSDVFVHLLRERSPFWILDDGQVITDPLSSAGGMVRDMLAESDEGSYGRTLSKIREEIGFAASRQFSAGNIGGLGLSSYEESVATAAMKAGGWIRGSVTATSSTVTIELDYDPQSVTTKALDVARYGCAEADRIAPLSTRAMLVPTWTTMTSREAAERLGVSVKERRKAEAVSEFSQPVRPMSRPQGPSVG